MIQLKNIYKSFGSHAIFEDLSLTIDTNTFVVIRGESGKGKTTLINIIGGIESVDQGEVIIDGKGVNAKNIRLLHRNTIGFLFQNFGLLEDETVLYNLQIVFPSLKERKNNIDKYKTVLDKVGLSNYENKKVCECSGGEKQRIAIARVLLQNNDIILCDEPTGSLDEDNRDKIIQLLLKLKEEGKTIVVVTHDAVFEEYADKIIHI